MKDYGPRHCIICGKEYIPRRSNQRTCASKECQDARRRLNWKEYQMRNYAQVLEGNRKYMARTRAEETVEPKPDTIVAIGYADRQKEQTLKMVGKVKVEL